MKLQFALLSLSAAALLAAEGEPVLETVQPAVEPGYLVEEADVAAQKEGILEIREVTPQETVLQAPETVPAETAEEPGEAEEEDENGIKLLAGPGKILAGTMAPINCLGTGMALGGVCGLTGYEGMLMTPVATPVGIVLGGIFGAIITPVYLVSGTFDLLTLGYFADADGKDFLLGDSQKMINDTMGQGEDEAASEEPVLEEVPAE